MSDPRHVIQAGEEGGPLLPSEALAGQGVAAFVLRRTDLDHLPVLTELPDVTPAGRDPYAEEARQPPELPADRRYRPGGGSWPEDGITLTYGELRRLIALHLAQLAHTMPRARPWEYADYQAQAMQDGETPLRLREVLE